MNNPNSKTMTNTPLIKIENLHKSYRMGKASLDVLRGVSMQVNRGEFTAIVGASGSGKSTLLHIAGLLDRGSKGSVIFDGVNASKLNSARRAQMRRRQSGFVFQFFHLLGELNVLENVMIAAMTDISTMSWPGKKSEVRQEAENLLNSLGLTERLKHRPMELSGGERQRVAIARALINKPDLLLADEPTGNLDSKTGEKIMDLLSRLNQDHGQTIVMVTHDKQLAARANRTLTLIDGRFQR